MWEALREEAIQSHNDVTESSHCQEEIQAPAKVEHPIMEDTKDWEETCSQDESCLFTNSFIYNDDIL